MTPFYYLMLVWALVFGFVVWGDVPSASLLVGSAIVVATGLFLFLREARLQQSLAAARRKAAGTADARDAAMASRRHRGSNAGTSLSESRHRRAKVAAIRRQQAAPNECAQQQSGGNTWNAEIF